MCNTRTLILSCWLIAVQLNWHSGFGYPHNHQSHEDNDILIIDMTSNHVEESIIKVNHIDDRDNQLSRNSTQEHVSESLKLQRLFESLWKVEGSSENIRAMQAALMLSYMNESVDPCDDFYEYACGNWETIHPIPKDKSELSVFSLLNNNILEGLRAILSNGMPDGEDGRIKRDVTDAVERAKIFYSTCVDDEAINRRGADPLLEFVDKLGGWPVLEDNWQEEKFNWQDVAIQTAIYGQGIILNTDVEIDLKDSDSYTIYLEEPLLGLGNREDFLNDENSEHLDAYRNLIETVLRLVDVEAEKAEDTAREIVDFEVQLANITTDSKTRIDLVDLYVPITIEELTEKYSTIDWARYLNEVHSLKLDANRSVILLSTNYYNQLIDLINTTDNRTLANYMVWRSSRDLIENLDERFRAAVQTFDEALTGQKEPLPRWKDCIKETNTQIGMAVGAMFVREFFDETSKKDVIQATNDLKEAFMESVGEIDWIDEDTKKLAVDKISRTKLAVGYPDFILSSSELNAYYAGLNIQHSKYFENSLQLAAYSARRDRMRLTQKVDKNQWPMYPAVVNAFFEQTKNRIVIPVGILQPPVYHRHFPQALNSGGIGVFIGHELTHGLDDIGREFDATGNMKKWWNNESVQNFQEKADCFIDQYSKFSVHGKFLQGEASKGENIADNGGIRQAFRVYQKWLIKNKDSKEILENEHMPGLDLSHEQLFFLRFAQSWCSAIRPEAVENRLQTDYHCPGKYRVLGTLSNFDEFANAYECPIGSAMNPSKKCKLW